MMNQQVLTVSELNIIIQDLLSSNLEIFWITGEISNLACPRSGHWYFTVKDDRSQVRCVMFLNKNRATKFTPENGMAVNLLARASFYTQRGDFQLVVETMLDAGAGKLQLAYQALVQKLSKEGLFEKEHKKEIPSMPKSIAVITSPTGAALQDILHVLERRNSLIPVKLYPSSVQGDTAHETIIKAIEKANSDMACDVIILARGGGSIEDLWPYNHELLARTIFNSRIPIITGIGHETDFTIADLVADYRAPTPSAAAEVVSADSSLLLNRLDQAKHKLISSMVNQLQRLEQRVILLKAKLKDPRQQCIEYENKIAFFKELLHKNTKTLLQNKNTRLKLLINKLDSISPLATLGRGYSIVQLESGELIKSHQQLSSGDNINITLRYGMVEAKVSSCSDTTSKELETCEYLNS